MTQGVVTLTGQVDSWREKYLAGLVAKGVRGVRDLTNDVEIRTDQRRSDTEVQTEIKQALRWDVHVDDGLVKVAVNNGTVELSGTVGSASEKSRAIFDAWVYGVQAVNAEDLDVKEWARDPEFRKTKYEFVSAGNIKQALKAAFYQDPRVLSFQPNIEVEAGVVTLSGTVTSNLAKRAAEEDASNVVGVYRVKNLVQVRPDNKLRDTVLTSKVEQQIKTDPYLESYEIDVSTFNGEVTLWGVVDSRFERRQAEKVASRVNGVVAVDNRINISEPFFYTEKSDWEISKDIRDELFWSPFVNSDEVKVQVEDGVAKLSGIVDTWSERIAARQNAIEGGALSVENDILVRNGPDFYRPES